jgi:phage terminase large subunit
MRTRERIVIDYNPSEPPEHWINKHVRSLPKGKVTVIHSTYLDNPFLPDEQVEAIERLKDQDPAMWAVYGLGQWAQLRGKIYTNRGEAQDMPQGKHVYGIDFGHTNPTAVVRVLLSGEDLYWQEVVYETHLTNTDLIQRLKAEDVPRGAILYCDAAEPDRIEELRRAGFAARPAKKDVKTGIDFCKRYRIVTVNSPNIQSEIAGYKWRENKQGDVLDEPVKYNDHAMDAGRYATFTHYFTPPAKTGYESVGSRPEYDNGAW